MNDLAVCECGRNHIEPCAYCKHGTVTQADLDSWGKDIFRRIDERMDMVAKQLNIREAETHTIALMAASLYGKTLEHPEEVAKNLYLKIQASLAKE